MIRQAQTPFLLASDLDGTLILPRPGRRAAEAIVRLRRWRRTPGRRLAYVTGRNLEQALSGIRRHGLPAPDALVCDVGTSVYRLRSGRWRASREYAAHMRRAFAGHSARDVRSALASLPGLELQGAAAQRPFKTSYFLRAPAAFAATRRAARARLRRAGIAHQAIFSVDPETGDGLLDILPRGVSKARAVEFLRRAWRLPPRRVAYAGDSGNDLHAWLGGTLGIVVGNTPEPVRRELRRRLPAARRARVHVSRLPGPEGVLEGLCRFDRPDAGGSARQ